MPRCWKAGRAGSFPLPRARRQPRDGSGSAGHLVPFRVLPRREPPAPPTGSTSTRRAGHRPSSVVSADPPAGPIDERTSRSSSSIRAPRCSASHSAERVGQRHTGVTSLQLRTSTRRDGGHVAAPIVRDNGRPIALIDARQVRGRADLTQPTPGSRSDRHHGAGLRCRWR